MPNLVLSDICSASLMLGRQHISLLSKDSQNSREK